MVGWRFDNCARCRKAQRLDLDEESTNRMVLLSDRKQHAVRKLSSHSSSVSLSSSVQGTSHPASPVQSGIQTWHPLVNVLLCLSIHERLKGFHCAWVPACAWCWRTDSIGYAEGGWRVVKSMRSVADLLVSRSCNETHWHRSVEGMFPPAASLSHLCHRLMPLVLRRPATMELAELVARATIKRRLRSKQTIQGRLTKKQPSSGNSLPLSSDPATETVPDVEEHPIVPERTEPWRPLTETEKNAWNALSPGERSVRRPGPQVASRTRTIRHQRHGGQSASKSCSSNSAGGRQTHALHGLPGECENGISSCDQWKGHGAWSSPADGQFLLEAPLEGGACQRHAVGGCLFERHSVRNFLEMCQRRKRGGCYKNRGSRFTDVQKQS